jgi:hypothetical protein
MIVSDGHGAGKLRETVSIGFSVGGKTKSAVGETVPESEIFAEKFSEVLDAHSYFALWSGKTINSFRNISCFPYCAQRWQTGQCPEERSSVGVFHVLAGDYNYIVILIGNGVKGGSILASLAGQTGVYRA